MNKYFIYSVFKQTARRYLFIYFFFHNTVCTLIWLNLQEEIKHKSKVEWIQFQFFGVEPIRKPYYYIWVTLEHAWLPLPDLMHSHGRPDIADIDNTKQNKTKKKDAAQPLGV